MAEPLFYVDLSEDARDYRHTALEPGLPLLDRQGVNFMILRKWLGDYVAEPEWRNANVVAFYMSEGERGRLEETDCQPVSKAELQKQFAGDLDELRAKIKKIKPESSTEQMVHRILKKNIAEQTNDLDNSDFDSYFFKCRAGKEEWRLVWCVGYQRADLEPLKAKLWATPDGDFLGVRPPLGGRAKKRKRTGPLSMLASPWLALALILLIALFLYLNKPTLVVTPAKSSIPLGSRVEYRVEDHRWYFFTKDVTPVALAQSNDPRVIEFEPYGTVANAKNIGRTAVSFIVGGRAAYAEVEVGPAKTPDRLTIEPAEDVRVAVGSTQKLKAIGHYDDGSPVDLTSQVSWWEADNNRRLVVSTAEEGLIEGDSAGETVVMAQFPIPHEDGSYAEASLDVQVVLADFVTLDVSLQPPTFAVGGSSRVKVQGVTADGQRHSLDGSSLLTVNVDPTTLARADDEYLVGRAEGTGEVRISYGQLQKAAPFTVAGRALDEDLFLVSPTNIDNSVVYELIPINVATASDLPIEASSADPAVVEVFLTEGENAGYEVWLAARSIGATEVTVTQGDKSATVSVSVTDRVIESMEFSPPVITLDVGQPETANLIATTEDDRIIKVAPDVLNWQRQPRLENVYVEKETLLLRPLAATESPQDMRVQLAETGILANATVEVKGGQLLAINEIDEETWGVYPPVPARGQYIGAGGYLGNEALLYDTERGGLMIGDVDGFHPLAHIPDNAILTDINGVSLVGMGPDQLAAYFRENPILDGDLIRYRGPDGLVASTFLGDSRRVVQDWKLLDVESSNLTGDSFDALLRMYLRQPAEYRLTDADGAPLSEWTAFPADATPSMVAQAIPRNAEDDYELFVERRIGDRVRKFQVSFKLEGEATRRLVDDVDLGPAVIDDGPDGQRVRERVRIRIPKGADPEDVRRALEGASLPQGAGAVIGSTSRAPTSLVSGAPAANPAAPNAPAANAPASPSPSADSPAPNSPAPNSPPAEPSPSSPSPAPPSSPPPSSPAPTSPAPTKPQPAPPNTPAAPNPAAPAPPNSAPPSSDTPAPAAQPKPAAGTPVPVDAPPSGSDAPAPSAYRPRTPPGSDTREPVVGQPAAGTVTGSATRGQTIKPLVSKAPAGGGAADSDDKPKSKFLDALKDYNRRDN
jgi:hypothetical protein